MKFLLIIALVVAAAEVLVHMPRGASQHLDAVSDLTMRDIARQMDSVLSHVGAMISRLFS